MSEVPYCHLAIRADRTMTHGTSDSTNVFEALWATVDSSNGTHGCGCGIYIHICDIYLKAAATTEALAVIDLYTALGAAAAPVGTTTEQHAPRRWGFHLPACAYTQLLP